MKKLFSLLLILLILLLLCGCSKYPQPPGDPTGAETAVPAPEPKPEPEIPPTLPEEVRLPVLMYHHFTEGAAQPNSYTVSRTTFERHMAAIKNAGYTAVTPHQLLSYLDGSAKGFPEKPIIITMDDGYMSNLEIAAPILERHGMNATVFVIGDMVGQKGEQMIPRFTYDEAEPYVKKGLITVQTHTHGLHAMDGDRRGVLKKQGESELDYAATVVSDIDRAQGEIEKELDTELVSVSYPFGFYDERASRLIAAQGVRLQFTSDYSANTVRRASLGEYIHLSRVSIGDEITPDGLVTMLDNLPVKK